MGFELPADADTRSLLALDWQIAQQKLTGMRFNYWRNSGGRVMASQ
ncbi:hypothetical protein ACQKB0_18580 [Mycobacterium tuberculosis]